MPIQLSIGVSKTRSEDCEQPKRESQYWRRNKWGRRESGATTLPIQREPQTRADGLHYVAYSLHFYRELVGVIDPRDEKRGRIEPNGFSSTIRYYTNCD